jgi:hypothetical protein
MTEQAQDPKARLEDMIHELALGRAVLADRKVETSVSKGRLEESEAWKGWDRDRQREQELAHAVGLMEAEIRTTALEVATELQMKDLQGVTVVARRTFEIADEDKATAWAKANMPEALVLDHRVFEKMVLARAGGIAGVPGVAYSEEEYGAARIDRDLSRYLAG